MCIKRHTDPRLLAHACARARVAHFRTAETTQVAGLKRRRRRGKEGEVEKEETHA